MLDLSEHRRSPQIVIDRRTLTRALILTKPTPNPNPNHSPSPIPNQNPNPNPNPNPNLNRSSAVTCDVQTDQAQVICGHV